MTAQAASRTGWVSRRQSQTWSALDRNFKAAASSTKPSTALTRASQTPPLGMREIHCGKAAKTRNGDTKAEGEN